MKYLLITISFFLCMVGVNAENLIKNAIFKINMGSGIPQNWLLSRGATGNVTALEHKNGSALELTGRNVGENSWWMQYLPKVKSATRYSLSVQVKASMNTNVLIYVESAAMTISSGILKGNEKWKTVSFDFEFPKLSRLPYVVFRIMGPGRVLFAEPSVTVADYSANLLCNHDFNGIAGGNGLPFGWTSNFAEACKRVTVDDSNGTGYGIQLENNKGDRRIYFIQRDVLLQAGGEYILSAKFKGSPGSAFGIYMECDKPAKTIIKNYKCTGKWEISQQNIKFNQLVHLPYMVLRLKGNGKVVITNLKLIPVPGTFKNGDFKSGTSGWIIKDGKIANGALVLKNFNGVASAIQKGIQLKGKKLYKITYRACGGNDKRYTDSQGATWFRVVPLLDGKPVGDSGRWLDSFSAWQTKRLTFQLAEDANIDLVCELKMPGAVAIDDITITETKSAISPLQILLNGSCAYRNGIYSANRNRQSFGGTIFNELPGIKRFTILFNHKKESVDNNGDKTVFTLPVPRAAGSYPIVVQAISTDEKIAGKTVLNFTVNPPASREVTFRKDRVMLIDGKPFFPLGVWRVGGKKTPAERMKLIAAAGFNIARIESEDIDNVAAAGMLSIVHVISCLPKLNSEAQFKKWDKFYSGEMRKIMNHPSCVGYYNVDEPAWAGKLSAPLVKAYEYIRKIDPYRPIMLNEAPRGKIDDLRPYTYACDIYGVDIYPIPAPNSHSDLDDKMMTSVGKYTDICREVVRDRKPVWMTLQAFAWGIFNKGKLIYPTHEQNRFMAYDAIVHGATGLFYWGINWETGPENWEFVKELGRTIKELRSLSAVLVSKTIKPAAMTSSHAKIAILHKLCNGKNYYIVINESGDKFKTRLKGRFPSVLNVLFEKRKVESINNVITEKFLPYEVHIYTDAKQLPAPLEQPKSYPVNNKQLRFTDDFKSANWIWFPKKNNIPNHHAYFIRDFNVPQNISKAELYIAADDMFRVHLNGKVIAEQNYGYTKVAYLDITKELLKAGNRLAISAADAGVAPCGLIFAIRLTDQNNKVTQIFSDEKTFVAEQVPGNWLSNGFTTNNWLKSEIIGKYTCPPWGDKSRAHPANPELIGIFNIPRVSQYQKDIIFTSPFWASQQSITG